MGSIAWMGVSKPLNQHIRKKTNQQPVGLSTV